MPAVPAGRGARRPRVAPADGAVRQSAGRAAAPLVCGAGGGSRRARGRAPAGADCGRRREDHPAGAGRAGGVLGRRARAACAADRRGATTARKKDPAIVTTLQALVEPQTAGDPMTGQRWVRRSLRHLSDDLGKAGHPASPPTVGRLLRALDYGLHANAKQVEAASHHPDRDAQFGHLAAQRQAFQEAGWPVVSVDTKKKELVGAFRNAGVAWRHAPEAVNAHDFPQDALGRAVPYGIYDLRHNCGAVYVGTSADTPRFAVDVLARWWAEVGRAT